MQFNKGLYFLVFGFFITGCNENGDKTSIIKDEKSIIVQSLNDKLPVVLDENTLLVSAVDEGDALHYKYVISADLKSVSSWMDMRSKMITNYCLSKDMGGIRNHFKGGVIYTYYDLDKEVYSQAVRPYDCKKADNPISTESP